MKLHLQVLLGVGTEEPRLQGAAGGSRTVSLPARPAESLGRVEEALAAFWATFCWLPYLLGSCPGARGALAWLVGTFLL